METPYGKGLTNPPLTSRKKFIKKCKVMHELIGRLRTEKTVNIIRWINQVLVGYYHYYGVNNPGLVVTMNRVSEMGDDYRQKKWE